MKRLPLKKKSESGQIILVVLLATVVILTIGLSVVSRSVTEVRISAQSQESARAFWVAQGSLEKAIRAKLTLTETGDDGDISYEVKKTSTPSQNYYIFPELIDATEKITFWLVNYNSPASHYDGDSLTLYWGNSGQSAVLPTTPALEATLIYKDASSNYYSKKWTFDPYSGRSPATNFSSAGTVSYPLGSNTFAFSADINNLTGLPSYSVPLLLELKLFFNTSAQQVGVEVGTGNVFDQQDVYESTATIINSNITRKLKEAVLWPRTPEIFDYLLFSGGNI